MIDRIKIVSESDIKYIINGKNIAYMNRSATSLFIGTNGDKIEIRTPCEVMYFDSKQNQMSISCDDPEKFYDVLNAFYNPD